MKNIPTEEDWGELRRGKIEDLDAVYAYNTFIGKSNSEMLVHYKDNVLARFEDLHFMPGKPFQYYIFGFRDYVRNGNFGLYESSDAASSFLELVLIKLQENKEHILPVLPELLEDVVYIANNQALYEADEDIYGNFLDLLAEIRKYAKDT